MDFSDQGSEEWIPGGVQLFQARRRMVNFQTLGYSILIFAASYSLLLVTLLTRYKTPFLRLPFFGYTRIAEILEILLIFSAGASVVFAIQLMLDVGSPSKWRKSFVDSRAIIDVNAALKLEANQRRSLEEFQIEGTAPSATGLTASAEIRDAGETRRWSSENYPFITRSIVERLQKEITTQGGRANTNLTIALLIAIFGLGILGWLARDALGAAASPPLPIADKIKALQSPDGKFYYVGSFAARSLLSISANVFAFFFLSSYRRNLSEIRYFHNELTNVQTRILSLYIATDRDIDDAIKLILKSLSITERNFILRKGETTTDLSLKGLDQAEVNSLASVLADIAKHVAPKTT